MTVAILPFRALTGVGSLTTDADITKFSQSCLQVMSFDDMIDTQFRTEALYVSYSVTGLDMWPRLRKGILTDLKEAGMEVLLHYFSFDWDNAGKSCWDGPTIQLFEEVLNIITTHPILSKWHTMYSTRHGARIIYKPDTPIQVEAAEEHLLWLLDQFKLAGVTIGTDTPEGHMDAACRDWTRCMVCPQVLHEGEETPSWQQPYYRLFKQHAILPNTLIGRLNQKTLPRIKTFKKSRYENRPVPSHADSLTQLQTVENGKVGWTDFYKRSRKAIKNTPYFDIIYNNAATGWEVGGRNDDIQIMLGVLTPILLRNCYASVNQIFALFYAPLLTLDTQDDWLAHTWNALLDIYERENDKLNVEKEKRAERARIELSCLDQMVEGMKEWCKHSDLFTDPDTAREFARTRALASFGSFFFTLGEDGYYCPSSVNAPQIISRIRKSRHLADIVPTTKPSITGEEIDLTPSVIQNKYSTSIIEIQMKPVGDRGGYIEDMDGEKPKLILSCFSRNDDLVSTYNEQVDGWLKSLGGNKYYKLIQWIGNALAFEEGLICALSLEGASNSGKKLLTTGLSECLRDPIIAGPLDIYGKSSAFIKTPFLAVNEAWPDQRGAGLSPADTFKLLLGGDGVRVEEKFKPAMWVLNPIRMILTANDDGIIRTLTKDKDMTPENRKAMGERLFHFRAGPADEYLNSIGGMGYTAKEGARWIRPDSGSGASDFVVAKHFMYLYKNREPRKLSDRFLVMGNSAPGCGGNDLTAFEKQLTDNKKTPAVATAIINMLDHKTNIWETGYLISEDSGQLFVTRAGVYKFIKEVTDNRLSERDVFSAMSNITAKSVPEKDGRGYSWYEIDVDILMMAAAEWGLECDTVRRLIDIKKVLIDEKDNTQQ